jgi:hypothetical protein
MSYPGSLPGDGGWCKRSGHLTPEQVRKRAPPPPTHHLLRLGGPVLPASRQDRLPACPSRDGVGPCWSLGCKQTPAIPGFQKVAEPVSDGASPKRHHTAGSSPRLQDSLSWRRNDTDARSSRYEHREGEPATVLNAGQDISELPACPPRVGHQQSTGMHKPSELIKVCVPFPAEPCFDIRAAGLRNAICTIGFLGTPNSSRPICRELEVRSAGAVRKLWNFSKARSPPMLVAFGSPADSDKTNISSCRFFLHPNSEFRRVYRGPLRGRGAKKKNPAPK